MIGKEVKDSKRSQKRGKGSTQMREGKVGTGAKEQNERSTRGKSK